MNIPLQIYDFIAIIFPSAILMTIFRIENPTHPIWQQTYQYGGIALMIVVLYLLGQVIQIIVRWLEKNYLTKWILKPMRKRTGYNLFVLNARKGAVNFPENIGIQILQSLSEFYGFDVTATQDNLFEMVYAPIHDRMAKRDVFLAISNMLRSMAVISILYFLFLVGKILTLLLLKLQIPPIDIVLLFTSILLFFPFRSGYHSQRESAEKIPYISFLAWFKLQKMQKK